MCSCPGPRHVLTLCDMFASVHIPEKAGWENIMFSLGSGCSAHLRHLGLLVTTITTTIILLRGACFLHHGHSDTGKICHEEFLHSIAVPSKIH